MFRKTISEDVYLFYLYSSQNTVCIVVFFFSKLDSPVCELFSEIPSDRCLFRLMCLLFCCEVQYKFHQALLQQHSPTVCTVCGCSPGIHTCSASTPRRGYCESGIAGYNCNLPTPSLSEEDSSPVAVIVRTREGTHSTGFISGVKRCDSCCNLQPCTVSGKKTCLKGSEVSIQLETGFHANYSTSA